MNHSDNTLTTQPPKDVEPDQANQSDKPKPEDETMTNTTDMEQLDKEIEERHSRKRITFFKKKFKMDLAGCKDSRVHYS